MPLTKIDQYEVMYSASAFAPRIWLKNGGIYIGQLVFHPEGQPLPPDGPGASNPSLHYHIGQFQHALDLLRNEGLVWLLYSGSGGGFENGLKTGSELTGEGEPRLMRFPG
ncbi:MAG TPA: hypothetical protein VHF86_08865 [Xanthomonadaceae bacterium]|nr:hypothetical protein [Xanthomonadaceae bacterium]